MRRVLRAAALAAWCALATAAFAQDRIEVVTTTTDLRSLTEAVGGEHVVVTSLVPPNMDAEDYQPKPQDVLRMKNARMFVRVGLDYDLWADRLLLQSGNSAIRRGGPGYVDASFAVTVLELRGMSVGPGDGHAHGADGVLVCARAGGHQSCGRWLDPSHGGRSLGFPQNA